MAKGIMGTIGLAATLVFAIPIGLLGLQFLVIDGQPILGAVFLGIAVLMVAVEEYVTTPTDVPGMILGKTVGAAVLDPDENGEGADEETSTRDHETK